ncbi:MAG: 2-phospho-L-lactate guanylyltransferase [Rhodobacteraceae bacterium]|nr:2-phospho-L-lactate guanylyltransferase [Paracoccaceae bacterium]
MTTLIVVPMKDPAQSKTRLATVLAVGERADLAKRLFCRTLAILRESQMTVSGELAFDLAVVTASQEIRALADDAGVTVISEESGGSLGAAVGQSADWAARHDYTRLGIIPADLAAPDPEDLRRLLARHEPVVVCPSLYAGTNALLVAPPGAIPFCYGPHSAERHLAAARTLGLAACSINLDSFRLDIDTSDCLSTALATDQSLLRESRRDESPPERAVR